jgi:O-antigen/teichoic acid export membrane protein
MTARLVFTSWTAYLAVTMAEVAATIVSLPIMTRMLSPAEYGLMLLIANTAALINLTFGFSLAQALPTLFAGTTSLERRRAISTTILVAITAVSAALYGTMAICADTISLRLLQTSAHAEVIAFGALASFLIALSLCLASVVRLQEWHKLYMMTQLPAVLIQLGFLIVLLVAAKMGLSALYIAMSAAGLFTTLVYVVAIRHSLTGCLDRHILAEATRIGARMLPWQFATLLTTNTAGFFLVRAGHIEQAGQFAVAASTVAVLVGLSNSFSNVWTPFVLLRHTEPDIAVTQRRVFEIYSAALLVAASGLGLFAQELFAILVGPAFRNGFHYVPPLAFAYCLFCFGNNFAQGLQAKQRTGHYAWIGAATAAVFLAVCLPLVGRFGPYSIIAAMAASFLTMLLLLQIVSERLMPVAYPWGRHALMWLAAACIVGLAYPLGWSWQGLAIKLTACLAIGGLPFLFGALPISVVHLAVAMLQSARSRLIRSNLARWS